jgi:hypothetical protein
MDVYPRRITYEDDKGRHHAHAFPHQEYAPAEHDILRDRPPLRMGVDGENWPQEGKVVTRTPGRDARGGAVGQWRRMADAWDVDLGGAEVDHVWDLGLGGPDAFENLWPIDVDANQAAGKKMYEQEVWWQQPGRPPPNLPTAVGFLLPGTFCVIDKIRRP